MKVHFLTYFILCYKLFIKPISSVDDDEYSSFNENLVVIKNPEVNNPDILSNVIIKIVQFYTDTETLLHKVENVVNSSPYDYYIERVAEENEKINKLIKRLDDFLENKVQHGRELDDEEFETFMSSINVESLEPKILISRINDEHEVLLGQMDVMAEELEEFNENLELLESMIGLQLRKDPELSEVPVGDHFDTSILTNLAEIYTRIEKYERILFQDKIIKIEKSVIEERSENDEAIIKNIILPVRAKLGNANEELLKYLEGNAISLSQFDFILNRKRQRIWELMASAKKENKLEKQKIMDASLHWNELWTQYMQTKELYNNSIHLRKSIMDISNIEFSERIEL